MLFHAITRAANGERFEELRPAEAAAGAELSKQGVVLETLLRLDGDGFFITVEASDAAGARDILNRLPFVSEGVVQITDLVEVRLA